MKATSQNPGTDTPRRHFIPSLALFLAIIALYVLNQTVTPGLACYLLSIPALALISFTALARVNDIKADQVEWNWHLRRFGLVFAGCGSAAMILAPLGGLIEYPSWTELMIYYGIAMTWFTTPGMPPWWQFMSKS